LGGTFFALDVVELPANASKDCSSCSLKRRCFHRKTKRRSLDVSLGAAKNNYSKAMQNKVDSDKGRQIYSQRFAVVEPVFANI
jgi:hypothetical protein